MILMALQHTGRRLDAIEVFHERPELKPKRSGPAKSVFRIASPFAARAVFPSGTGFDANASADGAVRTGWSLDRPWLSGVSIRC